MNHGYALVDAAVRMHASELVVTEAVFALPPSAFATGHGGGGVGTEVGGVREEEAERTRVGAVAALQPWLGPATPPPGSPVGRFPPACAKGGDTSSRRPSASRVGSNVSRSRHFSLRFVITLPAMRGLESWA